MKQRSSNILINGIGVDIEHPRRFKRIMLKKCIKVRDRIFTPKEVEYCSRFVKFEERFAGRFAAKEAILKALSSLPQTHDVLTPKDIEILPRYYKKPHIRINTRLIGIRKANLKIHLSISHIARYAVAFCVITHHIA